MAEKKSPIDIDNDDVSYMAFTEYLNQDTKRNQEKTAKEIEKMGYDLLMEIEKKQMRKNVIKAKQIKYILKHLDKYSQDTLDSYSCDDVRDIYSELKKTTKSSFMKFFNFLFNIE